MFLSMLNFFEIHLSGITSKSLSNRRAFTRQQIQPSCVAHYWKLDELDAEAKLDKIIEIFRFFWN